MPNKQRKLQSHLASVAPSLNISSHGIQQTANHPTRKSRRDQKDHNSVENLMTSRKAHKA